MREVQLLVAGAVAAVPFAVYGWLAEWPIGACATVVIVLYGVCGWLALRARRAWQAEVAAERRRKRAGVALSGSWPRNVRVMPMFDPADATFVTASCRECGEQWPKHLGTCSSNPTFDGVDGRVYTKWSKFGGAQGEGPR